MVQLYWITESNIPEATAGTFENPSTFSLFLDQAQEIFVFTRLDTHSRFRKFETVRVGLVGLGVVHLQMGFTRALAVQKCETCNIRKE